MKTFLSVAVITLLFAVGCGGATPLYNQVTVVKTELKHDDTLEGNPEVCWITAENNQVRVRAVYWDSYCSFSVGETLLIGGNTIGNDKAVAFIKETEKR